MLDKKPVCAAVDCKNDAHLQCPTCLKLDKNEGSFFCSQDCFKKSWVKAHITQFYKNSILNLYNRVLIKPFMATPSVIIKLIASSTFVLMP